LLSLKGTMTATEAGELLGESASSCSFHLRQLEKYGFVTEAGGGTGRKRPWKLVDRRFRFTGTGGAEQAIAARELSGVLMQRWIARHEAWQAVQDSQPEWAAVTETTEQLLFATVDELKQIHAQILELLEPYVARGENAEARPPGSRAIEMIHLSHPVEPESLPE
jgi:predicted ArsR family transcriptional regulator